MFIVEINVMNEERLKDDMEDMRVWLDHHCVQPDKFYYTFARLGAICHLEFSVESEAEAFAATFSGHLKKASGVTLTPLSAIVRATP